VASRPVVSNTSPLVTLAGVGLLALLPTVYGEIRIAEAVRDEYQAKRSASEPDPTALAWLVVEAVEPDSDLAEIQGLGRGEAATIALGAALQARAVVLDDRLGRRIAAERGLPVIGTMTVLLRAKQQGLLPAVGPVIAMMLAQVGASAPGCARTFYALPAKMYSERTTPGER
jgi:predicted nucleic acid-binding protein